MTDSQDSKDSTDERSMYFTMGATFLPLAVVLGITTDNWTIGLPFLLVGVTFLILGMNSPKKPGREKDDSH